MSQLILFHIPLISLKRIGSLSHQMPSKASESKLVESNHGVIEELGYLLLWKVSRWSLISSSSDRLAVNEEDESDRKIMSHLSSMMRTNSIADHHEFKSTASSSSQGADAAMIASSRINLAIDSLEDIM